MGCEHDAYKSNCVCDILLDIVEAQEKVDPTNGHCISGCSTALDELLGEHANTSPYNTIPVSLICKGTCDYFIGRGALRNGSGVDVYEAIAFRVVDVDEDNYCATLELLQPVPTSLLLNPVSTQTFKIQALFTLIDLFGYFNTGICITVDLNCFCGVTCHPATTPSAFSTLTAEQITTFRNLLTTNG
jgi:hypothetical protein